MGKTLGETKPHVPTFIACGDGLGSPSYPETPYGQRTTALSELTIGKTLGETKPPRPSFIACCDGLGSPSYPEILNGQRATLPRRHAHRSLGQAELR
jgi:hypothetical protein